MMWLSWVTCTDRCFIQNWLWVSLKPSLQPGPSAGTELHSLLDKWKNLWKKFWNEIGPSDASHQWYILLYYQTWCHIWSVCFELCVLSCLVTWDWCLCSYRLNSSVQCVPYHLQLSRENAIQLIQQYPLSFTWVHESFLGVTVGFLTVLSSCMTSWQTVRTTFLRDTS